MALRKWKAGVDYIQNAPGCPNCNVPTLRGIEVIFSRVLQLATDFALIVVFLYILYGGFLWLTAGSDNQKISQAQKHITYAVLGLVILIGSLLIIKAIEVITGVQLHVFKFYIAND